LLFHTWTFLIFFSIVYPVFLVVRNTRLRTPWLFLASYVFYGWWNPLYLLLIGYASALDFVAVAFMERSQRKGLWLAVSIVNNVGILSFFKYGGFLVENLNGVLATLHIGYALHMPDVTLPVGISFHVFQSMSYIIDYYGGKIEREKNLLRYMTFVSFFPQLVAGPIERARHLLPQLQGESRITSKNVTDGVSLFVVGLFKKVVLADFLTLYVDKVYADPAQYDAAALALATFAFAWQIYFDFSGYTDMARGIGSVMGFQLLLNFRNPYLATDLGDFWSRWHISLSSWFRDYVYVPLGGNRGGAWQMYRNIFLTMLISGLWHGAAWTFVIWGALHAVGRMATRELERTAFYRERVPRLVKQVLVFSFVTFTWIFFRATSVEQAWTIIARIATASWTTDPRFPLVALGLVVSIWAYQFVYESPARKVLELAPVRVACVVGMMLCVALFASSGEHAFIYFQF
jgi:D-alanyl-lipoteichoic acid acyltransferase DltB (MBOAT superfamily)